MEQAQNDQGAPRPTKSKSEILSQILLIMTVGTGIIGMTAESTDRADIILRLTNSALAVITCISLLVIALGLIKRTKQDKIIGNKLIKRGIIIIFLAGMIYAAITGPIICCVIPD